MKRPIAWILLSGSCLGGAFLTACSDESDVEPTVDGTSGAGASGPTTGAGASSSTGTGAGGEVGTASCKRGIAYGHHSQADFAALQPAVAWWYNWAYRPDQDLRDGSYRAAGVEYVPMVWGADFDVANISASIPDGATTLLGFNEPNFGEQANISAAEAAALWPQVESIADARGLTLVSPAVNFCGGDCQETDPFKYLDDFFAACPGCRVDRVAFHIYVGCNVDGENKAQWLINHTQTYEARFSQPLWLTEFACTDAQSFDDQIGFLEDAVAYLEANPRIERYSWFSGRFEGIPYVDLLGDDGQLTPLGQAYVDAPVSDACEISGALRFDDGMTSTLSQPRPALDGSLPETLTFEAVYDATFPVVWRTARRLGIPAAALDDVCQEVFVIVFRRLDDYDGRASVKSWVCGILVNVVRDHRRRRRRKDASVRSQGPLVDASDLVDPATSPCGEAQRSEATRIASALLDEMDDAKRQVFVLAELEEMTAPEIAEVVGANVNTVYARLRAARQQFRRSAERFRARRSGSES